MATLNVDIRDFDIEADEISLMSWEAPAILEESGITPEDLHGEWSALDLYIQNDCTTALNFERVAQWIAEGDLSDGQLSDLSYRIARELVGRLYNVRRELERVTAPDAARA